MKHKILFIGIAVVMLVVIIGSSYAFLSSQSEGTKDHIVKAGKLEIRFTDENNSKINLEGAYPIPDSEGMRGTPHTFTITNTGTLPLSYQISLEDNTSLYNSHNDTGKIFGENQLKLGITNSNGNTTYQMYKKGALIEGTLDASASATYTIRLWIPEHIGNEVQGFHFHANIKVDSVQTLGNKNQNITKIYAYNQEKDSSTFCVTGEESTCQEITTPKATYDVGTIIKYKVNDTEEKYFHVMFDNGDTLTLQQRENTVYKTPWYSSSDDNTQGPITALSNLEDTVNSWVNVNDLTYALGAAIFKDNQYTGCSSYNLCTTNAYTLGQRTAKARLISVQEAQVLGCSNSRKSCPVWMYNYLQDSTSYGGTVNQSGEEYGSNIAYWTTTARENFILSSVGGTTPTNAWNIYYGGNIDNSSTKTSITGTRAVVEINKLDKEAIKTIPRNEFILAIFKYNQNKESANFCVTGEEHTCEQIYETPMTYETGTIIKYKVNDSEEKYFHVMFDNGNTLTLQQRENIISGVAWNNNSDSSKGPLTALAALESKTSTWTNVLDQTYTLGSTIFKDNAFTGCSTTSCTNNLYTLPTRTAKARLITIQELSSLGCKHATSKTCPVWSYNYLHDSISYGGTINIADGKNYAYWTSSANSSTAAWYNGTYWSIGYTTVTVTGHGVRPVVVIQK